MNDSAPLSDALIELLLARVTDEFLKQLDRGERPDIEDYARRYPKIAPVLRQMLPTLSSLRGTLADPNFRGYSEDVPQPELGRLGDFRIVREAGRGGMGVVYEARQISLDRRVALKVLPFVSVLDPRRLQRFRNEAQAAAQLHHPGIVPVYSVGCERGVHYFAMQFIEGQTLAKLIHDLREEIGLNRQSKPVFSFVSRLADRTTQVVKQSRIGAPPAMILRDQYRDKSVGLSQSSLDNTKAMAGLSTKNSRRDRESFRMVARLGVQAAGAIEHAHSHGVVHRDIKPANLLIDELHNLWITDFGLAHFQSDVSMTTTGDLLGTIRYMSPEQALAKRVGIDHRTDVYSLGATLYELLTLEPVFDGGDREQILRQIAFDEPRPPRRINAAIPVELEIIVLKALAKNPDERYSTAQDLADDLQRYLNDQPIRARRNTLIDRSRKWARRHPAWIAATGLVLCLTIILLGVSNVLIALERDAKGVALHAKDDALAKAKKAEENEAARRIEADKERERAEAHFRMAREAVDRVFTLAAEKMADKPHLEQIRRALLEDALEFYQGFLREKSNDPSVRLETARAYWRVGTISEILGRNEQAEVALKEGIILLKGLATEFPAVPEYLDDLIECQSALSSVFQQMHNRSVDHIATRRIILDLAEKRVAARPAIFSYARRLATCHIDYANAIVLIQPAEAERHCRQALEIGKTLKADFPNEPEDRKVEAFNRHWLGKALAAQNLYTEAEAELRISVKIREELLAENPENISLRSQLAHVYGYLANALEVLDKLPEAEEYVRRSIRITEKLTEDDPYVLDQRRKLSDNYVILGEILATLGRKQDAVEAFRKSLTIRERIVSDSPNLLKIAYATGWNYYRLGILAYDESQPLESIEAFRKALNVFETAVKNAADETPPLNALAWFLVDCPAVQFRDPERAVALARKCLQSAPGSSQYWSTLGTAQYRAGHWRDAIESLQKSIESGTEGAVAEVLFIGMAYWRLGEQEPARQLLAKAEDSLLKRQYHGDDVLRYRREAETLIVKKNSE